jgi:hypothetical protein
MIRRAFVHNNALRDRCADVQLGDVPSEVALDKDNIEFLVSQCRRIP